MKFKLGRKPRTFNPAVPHFSAMKAALRRRATLQVPTQCSYISKMPANLGMMLNDTLGCHDDKTEVLTEHGWQRWPEYTGGLLGTMNRITGRLEFQAPSSLIRYDYDGPLYYTNHRGLDFGLTPNHRMWNRPYKVDTFKHKYVPGSGRYRDWQFNTIDNLSARIVIPGTTSGHIGTYLKTLRIGDRIWDGDNLIKTLSLIISDGWVGGTEANWNRSSFCCFDEKRYDDIAKLAQAIGACPLSRKGVWYISDAAFACWLRANIFVGNDFHSAYKRVPDIVKVADQAQINLFLNSYGDQNWSRSLDDGRQFYTCSRSLVNDFQELGLRSGRRMSVNVSDRTGMINTIRYREFRTNYPSYTIMEWKDGSQVSLERSRKSIETDHYRGEVFCAEVPNSTLVTRRNDSILISGNCCTVAAMYHAIQVWTFNAANGQMQTNSDSDVLDIYEQFCGYVDGDPATDQGGNEQTVLSDWLKQGVPTSSGNNELTGFLELDPRNLGDVAEAIYECGLVYIGFEVPSNIMPENADPPELWTYDPSATIEGGHAVILPGYSHGPAHGTSLFDVVSWGSKYKMTYEFFQEYVDEAYALIDPDWLTSGKSPLGLSTAQLNALMSAIRAQ